MTHRMVMLASRFLSTTAILAAVALAGCSSDDAAGGDAADGTGGGTGGDTAAGGSAGSTTAEPEPCSEEPSTIPDGAICVHDVYGKLVHEDETPVEGDLLVTACGPTQCNPGFTDADGTFAVPVNQHIVPGDYSVIGHGRPEKAAFYFQVPTDQAGPDIDIGTLHHLSMPADGPLIVVDREGAPAQSVTSNGVTLEIPDGIFVALDVEAVLFQEEGREFKALRVPDGLLDEFIDPSMGALAVWGFEPFEAQFETPGTGDLIDVRLSFDNSFALDPGASVEVLALGSYLHPDWITPASFEAVATATVSDDGSVIELDAGQGVTYLTWVAIRPAP